jgi:hypothetical protein
VLDFTLLDADGREIESVGVTTPRDAGAVNMGRMEAAIQGIFVPLAGQTPSTLRLVYIPAADEKILTLTVRDLPVP